MRDIVATIQTDQYRLITRGPEPPLVVQGGPGTGKTAVGLHRASYLLYTHREELRRVLVVGPNPTFMIRPLNAHNANSTFLEVGLK